MKAAVIQLVSSASIQANLSTIDCFLLQAKEEGASLVLFPENFAFMGLNDKDKWNIAEFFGQGEVQDWLSQRARMHGLWIIAGSMALKGESQRVRSSCLVFDDKGLLVGRYDKIHLFDVQVSKTESHRESLSVEPGTEMVVVDTPIGRVGLSICYDLRFPELYLSLTNKGAEILVVPSAFTAVTGKAHWEVLLRARAIENLCYVLASNQGGLHQSGRETYGHSMIIDPWGKILTSQASGEGILFAEINLESQVALRQRFPSIKHHVLGH